VTDPLGHETSFTYDSKGNLLTETNALNKTWTYTYTSNNDIDLETDPLNRKSDYIYDSSGNLTRIARKDSSNNVKALVCLERDSAGLVTAVVQSTDLVIPSGATDQCTGNRLQAGYDTYGNLNCLVNPRFSSATQTCSQRSTKATFSYDAGSRQLSSTNELRQPVSTGESGSQCGTAGTGNNADEDGDTVKDDGCPSEKYVLDNMNSVTSVTDALGNTTSFVYDAKGNRTKATDANRVASGTAESGSQCGSAGTGNGTDEDGDTVKDDGCPSAITEYDAASRVTKIIDALGKATTMGYDANGKVTSLTNARRQASGSAESGSQCGSAGTGNETDEDGDTVKDDGCPSRKYVYDAKSQLTSETDGVGRVTAYQYYDDGLLKQRTDARNLVTKYFFDAGHRLDLIEYWNGTLQSSVDYGYDDVGNRTSMVDSTGTTSYQYDALNRILSATFPGSQVVSYTYDDVPGGSAADYPGQRTKITYPDSKAVSYTYEVDGAMKTVTDWQSKTTTYTWDNAGRLQSTTLGNGLITDYTYDAAHKLLTLVNRNGGNTISSYSYTLDKVGNRTQVVDTNGTTAFSYDALYQLTGVTYPNSDTQSYTYDAAGNRLSKVHNSNTTNYTYDGADQMKTAGSTNYTYDNNGNQTGRGSDTFSWDHENRLTSTSIGGTSGSYTYNGDGLRMSRTIGGQTVSYKWDVASALPNVIQDSAGNSYVYGLDLISRTDSGGNQEYYLADGLGSTTGLANGSGSVTASYQYDAFGAIRSQTGSSPNEFTFTGEHVDSTGLQYLRARFYDSATGRFISQDPVPYVQRYSYAFNNPPNLVDPTGLSPLGDLLGEAADALAECAVNAAMQNDSDGTMCRELLAWVLLLEVIVTDGWQWAKDCPRDLECSLSVLQEGPYFLYYASYQIARMLAPTVRTPWLVPQFAGLVGDAAMDIVIHRPDNLDELKQVVCDEGVDAPVLPETGEDDEAPGPRVYLPGVGQDCVPEIASPIWPAGSRKPVW
jgi:RHS repeat-associated protein